MDLQLIRGPVYWLDWRTSSCYAMCFLILWTFLCVFPLNVGIFSVFVFSVSPTQCRAMYTVCILFLICHFVWNLVPMWLSLWGSHLWGCPLTSPIMKLSTIHIYQQMWCCGATMWCGTPRVGHKETVHNPNEKITISTKVTNLIRYVVGVGTIKPTIIERVPYSTIDVHEILTHHNPNQPYAPVNPATCYNSQRVADTFTTHSLVLVEQPLYIKHSH